MSKVRADQFPNYSSVSIRLSRLDSRKIPLVCLRKCVFNLLKEILTLLNISKNIENLSKNSMVSPLYDTYNTATLRTGGRCSTSQRTHIRCGNIEIIRSKQHHESRLKRQNRQFHKLNP